MFFDFVQISSKSRSVRRKTRTLSYEFLELRRLFAIGDLRIANYNVRGFDGSPSTEVGTILSAIGNETYNGRVRPLDVIVIQEVQTQATTTQSVVSQLNTIYGAGRYSRGTLNGASLSGNETIGLIYNTQTIELVSELGIGTPSSTAAARQPIRYKLRPLELAAGNDFYVYNSHYKASDSASDRSRRNAEAVAIRADADALGSANIIYAGDFNLKTHTEAAYQTLLAAGAGQAVDPINRPGSWNGNASFRDIFTQAPAVSPPAGFVGGGINDRFDFQLLSTEWLDGVGLDYAPGSYHTFGNNGSVAVNGSINDPSNTALPGFANRTTLLNLLTTVTDHLPLVVDYYFANQPPTNISITSSTLSESAPLNSIVGTLSSTDPNASDTHTYSLVAGTGSTNNSSFTIVGNTLRSSSTFALDGTANYSVRVRTTDSAGLTFEKPITLTVTNAPPTLSRVAVSLTGNVGATLTNTGTFADVAADTVTLSASFGTVVKTGSGNWQWTVTPTTSIASQTVTITGNDEDGGSSTVTFVISARSTVATRGLFYNNATGSSASTSLSDKVALLPGQSSSFSNYTNYSLGLNGVVIDLVGLPVVTTDAQMAASLQFASWNGIDASGFVALPGAAIPTVNIVSTGGAGGSARVRIVFPNNTVQNTWLRITVLANANTGLAANDVFYFGNVIGDLDFGNTATRLRVNGQDAALILANQSPGVNSANVANRFDLDRNGRVNGLDYAILLKNQQASGIVAPLTAPSSRSAPSSRASASSYSGGAAPFPFSLSSTKSDGDSDSNLDNLDNLETYSGQFASDRDSILQAPFLSKQLIFVSDQESARQLLTSNEKKRSNFESLDKYFASLWEGKCNLQKP